MVRIAHVVALSAVGLAACTGGEGGEPASRSVSASVGAGGGTVALAGGPALTVPAGALGAATTLSIEEAGTAPSGSPIYAFGPAGQAFAVPVRVAFPRPSGLAAASVYWTVPGSATTYDALPATLTAAAVEADVTHFSRGFVGAACAPGAACTPANACHHGTTTCNGAPACVDAGTRVDDGAACGSGGVCAGGVCGSPACVNLAGSWRIVQHCSPAYVGVSIAVTQAGCTLSTWDPIRSAAVSAEVSGTTVTDAADGCSGSVATATWTWSWTCGDCAQVLVRQ